MNREVIALTRDLLKIPSPSGNERQLGKFLARRLEKTFQVKLQKIGDRFNILATVGEPKLLLTTHMDTVPKELPLKENKNWMHGRGACDAKGIIAAMVCAAEEAVRLGRKDFGLLLDVSEETDFSGIKRALPVVNPKMVIVGEPTKNKVVSGQKGLWGIKIQCEGRAAPGATPEKGISAINMLLERVNTIREKQLPADKKLGKTTLNIGQIQGGRAPNVVADYAEAILEVRTICPNSKIEKVLLRGIPKKNIKVLYSFDPVMNTNRKFLAELKCEKEMAPYFTEMYFWAKKAKTIVLGPGDYRYAHTDVEKIRKSDIIKGEKIYLELIKTCTKER